MEDVPGAEYGNGGELGVDDGFDGSGVPILDLAVGG